jgi:hypothetical protein
VPRRETTTVRRRREPRQQAGQRTPRGRYGLLLILLIVTYLLSAFFRAGWVAAVQLVLFVSTEILALRGAGLPVAQLRLIGAVVTTGSAVALGLTISQPNQVAVAAASIWTGLLLLATVALVLRRILSYPRVTEQSIFGAVSAYMILGLMYASFYAAIYRLHADQFFAGGRPGNPQTFQYFSFTTLTTLGYGDFTAIGSGGRAVAVIEALSGQVFLATLVARLVAAFRPPVAEPRDEPPGGQD